MEKDFIFKNVNLRKGVEGQHELGHLKTLTDLRSKDFGKPQDHKAINTKDICQGRRRPEVKAS